VCANDAPVVNLFCNLQEFTQKKRQLIPRDESGHTPVRKKHGQTTHLTASVKAQGAVQELLAAELSSLHVDDSFDGVVELSDVHWTILTHDCDKADDGINKSDNDNYHPPSVAPPPSSSLPLQKHKKKIKPKIVLDCSFMTFLCP
jgi:hypothetical protein